MSDKILIAIISAGLATFVNCLFQLVNKVLDNHKENKREQKTQLNEYILKKETIYISAIDRLLQIRRGFDYTRKDIINNKELQEEIKENNQNFFQIAANYDYIQMIKFIININGYLCFPFMLMHTKMNLGFLKIVSRLTICKLHYWPDKCKTI